MSASTSSIDTNNMSTPSRSPSENPSTPDLRISIATPVTVKTDLDASEARSRKRKALGEPAETNVHKISKISSDGTPVKNRGGRPRRETPLPPKQPSGPLRLRVSKPVKAFLPPELWKLVLEQSSPALLLRARTLNRNFYTGLTNGSLQSIWVTSRQLTYGNDHPAPPTGIDEIQYADLLEGQGCQSCKNIKTRKTYWAFLRRWCEECLNDRVVPVEEAQCIMHPYTNWQQCVPRAVRDSWNHYQWAGERVPQPDWAKYQKHAHLIFLKAGPEGLDSLKAKLDERMQSATDRALHPPNLMEDIREDMEKKMIERRTVEDWEGRRRVEHRKQTKGVLDQRTHDVVQKAAQLTPPIPRADLEKLQAFKNASVIAKPLTDRSWKDLKPKLLAQLRQSQENEVRTAEESDAARILVAKAEHGAVEAHTAEYESTRRTPNDNTDAITEHLTLGYGGLTGNAACSAFRANLFHGNHGTSNSAIAALLGLNASHSSNSTSSANALGCSSMTSSHRHLPPPNAFWPQSSYIQSTPSTR